MKNFTQNRSLGFYLGAVIAVLTAIGMAVYPSSIHFIPAAELLMGVALAVELLYMVGGRFVKSVHWELMAIPVAVLITVTICTMLFYQVEQIGWCIAGLDGWSILTAFLIAAGMLGVGLVLSIIGCFCQQNKR